MADIFFSYAHEDRTVAQCLVKAFEDKGWSVWWDQRLDAGNIFDEVIESQLRIAGCVVVIWSRHSVGSQWVRTEAADGLHRGILIPATIDSIRPPLQFRMVQTEQLFDSNGRLDHSAMERLLLSISKQFRRNVQTAIKYNTLLRASKNARWLSKLSKPYVQLLIFMRGKIALITSFLVSLLLLIIFAHRNYDSGLSSEWLMGANFFGGSQETYVDVSESAHLEQPAATKRLVPLNLSAKGTLIAYATAPGRVARASPNDISPFTDALVRQFMSGDGSVLQMFQSATVEVYEKTNGEQIPTLESYVFGDFILRQQDVSNRSKRIALVIGNSKYRDGLEIYSPSYDAQVMTTTLRLLGYDVQKGTNLSREQMISAIRYFGRSLGAQVSSIFYYSGIAFSTDGFNFMIPVDADIKSEKDVAYFGISLGDVLVRMQLAESGPNIIIVDACRNDPFRK